MLTKPKFIYIPPLYEEGTATVSWENTDKNANYELDAVFNETFDEASAGMSWTAINNADWSWQSQEGPNALSWSDIAALPAQGLSWQALDFMGRTWAEWDGDPAATWLWMEQHAPIFTIYRGAGEDVPAPDQGLHWAAIDAAPWTWANQEGPDALSWKEISLLPSVGLNWGQHDSNNLTWSLFEQTYDNWSDFEKQAARGISWASFEARQLDWNAIERLGADENGLSWYEWEHLQPDSQTHKGFETQIPLNAKTAMLRLRAYDDTEYSEYITSSLLPVIPIFYREDAVELDVVQGKTYWFEIVCDDIQTFSKVAINLEYSNGELALTDTSAQTSIPLADSDTVLLSHLEIVTQTNGQVQFKCNQSIPDGEKWSGLITVMEFKALKTGKTQIKMF